MAVLALGRPAGTNARPTALLRIESTTAQPAIVRGRDLQVVGLAADGSLVCFQDDWPRAPIRMGTVTGPSRTDAKLVGIDYRPANGQLYGVGNAGGVYIVDPSVAEASLVSRMTVPLLGHPVRRRLQPGGRPPAHHLRHRPEPADQRRRRRPRRRRALNNLGTPPVSPALGVTGVAYTNNDADPNTATTLFDIDTAIDQVAVQAPANAGTLNPTGKLGVDAAGPVGFDIYSDVGNGTTVGLRALASIALLRTARRASTASLLTGRASAVGSFQVPVVDIAIPTAQS